MQMLPIKNRAFPESLHRVLSLVPACLLALVVATALFRLGINLAAIEPFDAYLFQVAGWATIAIAFVGLVASAFIPLAYCKYGCPTGALLEFVRSHGAADRFRATDILAGALVGALALIFWQYEWIAAAIAGLPSGGLGG